MLIVLVLVGCSQESKVREPSVPLAVTEVIIAGPKESGVAFHATGFVITFNKIYYEITASHVVQGDKAWQTHYKYDLAWRIIDPVDRVFIVGKSVGYRGLTTVWRYDGTAYRGRVVALEEWQGSRWLLTVTGASENGSSGAPLLDDLGNVIGIHIETSEQAKYAVPIEILLDILGSKG